MVGPLVAVKNTLLHVDKSNHTALLYFRFLLSPHMDTNWNSVLQFVTDPLEHEKGVDRPAQQIPTPPVSTHPLVDRTCS